ncbi:hypothetical protein AB4090_12945 [Acidithiobacillus sp. IBUN Pt1247-S3]|uniref:hypothetical protein n=1 Tax=Acidithiobacillus sp. IBUN Pt1247-S3 TaxID=3166642 RepID=UPI0034E44C1B
MNQTMQLKQSVDALAQRVVRMTEEYTRSGVALWICQNGATHVIPLTVREPATRLKSHHCALIGHYRAPCQAIDIVDDIEWIVRQIRTGHLH